MMKRNIRKKPFTLIELLVSMGLLTLLVMLMLQLFSGAQRLWIASDKRGNLYADVRVAMELMSEFVNSAQFSHGEDAGGNRDTTKDMVFSIRNNTNATEDSTPTHALIFAAKSSRDLPHKDSNTFFIAFQRGSGSNRGKLYMTVCSDNGSAASGAVGANYENNFYSLFPPYNLSVGYNPANRNAALTLLRTQLTPQAVESEYSQVIAENVIGLEFNVYTLNAGGVLVKSAASGDHTEPPYMLEIRLSALNKDDYEKYSELSETTARDNFLNQHKHTFTRSVFLGNRWALEAK